MDNCVLHCSHRGLQQPREPDYPHNAAYSAEGQKQLEAAMYGQAQVKCQYGKVAVATQTANATTNACVSSDDPAYKAKQAAKQPEKPAK